MQLEAIGAAISYLLGLGPSIMMPVIITLLSVVFGAPLVKSARAGIAYGIGFMGIGMVLGLIIGALAPVSNALVMTVGFRLKSIDLSWVYLATAAWAWPGAPLIFPVLIAVNLVYLALGPERGGGSCLDADLWNYWESSYVVFAIWLATGNVTLGLIVAAIYFYTLLREGDWGASLTQDPETYNFPSICWPHPLAAQLPFQLFVDRVILDKIPFIAKSRADPEALRDRFGVIGDPIFIGFFIGAILGAVALTTGRITIAVALNLCMSTAAAMLLMPRMVGILMEGLLPLSDAAKAFMEKRFPGREINVGLDWAIAAGYITIIAAGAMVVPVTLLLAIILPGNIVIPYGDLAVAMVLGLWFAPLAKGNVLRTFIGVSIMSAVVLYGASFYSNITTVGAQKLGLPVPAGFLATSWLCASFTSMVYFIIVPIYFLGGDYGKWLIGGGIYDPTLIMIICVAWAAFELGCWWFLRNDVYRVAATPKEEFFKKGAKSWEEVLKLPEEKKKAIYGLRWKKK